MDEDNRLAEDASSILASGHKPTVPEVRPLLRRYYAKPDDAVGSYAMGGSLHAVLDDGNIADRFVESSRDWSAERGDEEGRLLAEILLRMSRTQRHVLSRGNYYPW